MSFRHVKATVHGAGEHNRRMVFQLVRRLGVASRQQIAEMTSLHRSSLSKIMTEFISCGLVREVAQLMPEVRRVGKRRILLQIRPEAGWALGIGVSLGWARMAIVNVAGGEEFEHRIPISSDLDRLADTLKAGLDAMLAGREPPRGRLLAVGVAVPGIVDSDTGVLLYSDYFRMRNFPLAQAIEQALGVPACADNDARVEALAHLNQPNDSSGADFVFLYLNHRERDGGVHFTAYGSAIVIHGQIYRGAHYGAGEIWGRLHPLASPPLLKEDLEVIEREEGPLNPRLEALAEAFAPIAATLAGYIDPVSLVLGGSVGWRNVAFRRLLEGRVNELIQPWYPERRVRVEAARVPAAGTAYGAALLAFDRLPMARLLESAPPGEGLSTRGQRNWWRRARRHLRPVRVEDIGGAVEPAAAFSPQ